jgi:hypothetical protein
MPRKATVVSMVLSCWSSMRLWGGLRGPEPPEASVRPPVRILWFHIYICNSNVNEPKYSAHIHMLCKYVTTLLVVVGSTLRLAVRGNLSLQYLFGIDILQ